VTDCQYHRRIYMRASLLVLLMYTVSGTVRNSSVMVVFGDWGMDTSDFRMGTARLETVNAKHTILLGDNFYDDGVKSVDDPLWELFRDIRNTSDTFYAIVGNHDYIHSAQAQVSYSKTDPQWVMPALYYYSRIDHTDQNGSYICGVFLDSYKFDETQLRWVKVILSSGECQSDNAYRFVFSHHPIHTVGVFQESDIVQQLNTDLKPVLEEYKVHAFIAGHEHDMQVFRDNGITYLISGAFSDKYSTNSETANDTSLVWRNVGTAGFLQLYPETDPVRYEFIASVSGGCLFSGKINKTNDWSVESVSQRHAYSTFFTFQRTMSVIILSVLI